MIDSHRHTEIAEIGLGRTALMQAVIKRIERHCRRPAGSAPSLTVGLLAAAGSGRSYLLDKLYDYFEEQPGFFLESDTGQSPILPIPFNPQRFEAEQHLVVPLLMAARLTIFRWRERDECSARWLQNLNNMERQLGRMAVAFSNALKSKMGVSEIEELEFNMGRDYDSLNSSEPDDFTTLYYDFRRSLAQVTGRDSGRGGGERKFPVNLLFLIDDLDRCSAPRMMQLLDAIKLLMSVEGIVVVLAVDDETVARRIDAFDDSNVAAESAGYRPPRARKIAPQALSERGIDYLEKVVDLPLRLPLPGQIQVREFLGNTYPDLFTEERRELLELFATTLPALPRRLIKAAELLELSLDIAAAVQDGQDGQESEVDALLLARVVPLQLFAPDIYRLGQHHPAILLVMARWAAENGEQWRSQRFLHQQTVKMEQALKSKGLSGNQLRYIESVELPLLRLVHNAVDRDDGFDPRMVVHGARPEQLNVAKLSSVFNLLDCVVSTTTGSSDGDSADGAGSNCDGGSATANERDADEEQERPPPIITDSATSMPHTSDDEPPFVDTADQFLDGLLKANGDVWQSAVVNEIIIDNVFEEAFFERFLQRFSNLGNKFAGFLDDYAWLSALIAHLSETQFARFDECTALLDKVRRWLNGCEESCLSVKRDDEFPEGTLAALDAYTTILWPSAAKKQLQESEERLAEALLAIVEHGKLRSRRRADVSNTLGRLGDPRFAETLFYLPARYRGRRESHLGFVPIKGGSFVMGSNYDEEDARDNEMVDGMSHHVGAVDYDYWMSRYPVTVAQYGAFIKAQGYNVLDNWSEHGRLWLNGNWDSQLTEDDFPDSDAFNHYKEWISRRSPELRRLPMGWHEQEKFGNRPVVGVSWFEAQAYCRWLDGAIRRIDGERWIDERSIVRLPTEAEWEKAARAGRVPLYPWGNAWDSKRANVESQIGHVSAVGLLPRGKNSHGMHDLAGNVWEWTHSTLRDYPYQSEQSDWGERQAGEWMVVRGGSWFNDRRHARCACRGRGAPDLCNVSMGFRLAVAPSSDA
ncbi:MAG: SUMF1/EgtB/PvdO family nonheme iron enzyme [Gammaproteobacteria bacterium]|nr:SUMF1/EgtB/PvdO family nonheme iron enzyme [Gammaproteobacteria bacterium]